MNQKIYKFGQFLINRDKRQLFFGEEPIFLSPKAFEILFLLVENSGKIVEKETLFERVWANSFVEENNLPVHISLLRRIFKEKSAEDHYIRTISGRGYIFTANVQLINSDEVMSLNGSNRGKNDFSSPLSIAVLPFSHDPANENLAYLSNGITHSLIDDLSQISNLKVLAFSAVKDYLNGEQNFNDIRFMLGANRILTGQISEFKGRLEINAELINAEDQTHLWGIQQTFEPDEIFSLRKEISLNIAEELKLRFTEANRENFSKQTRISQEAEKFFFRGKLVLESRNISKDIKEALMLAISYFKQALKIEPDFAHAYIGIGMAYVSLYNHCSDFAENYPKAKQALHMALSLDNSISQAYVLKASIEVFMENNLQLANQSLDEAIRLNPNNPDAYHWKGIIHMRFGEFAEAVKLETKAIEFDPFSSRFAAQLMRIHYFAGEYHKAIAQAEEILELTPGRSDCYLFLAQSYGFLGMHEKALEEIENAIASQPTAEMFLSKALLLAMAGKEMEARQLVGDVFENLGDNVLDYSDAAPVYTALNDFDTAFSLIDEALSKGSTNLGLLKIDPRFKNLRRHPRFEQYLGKLNLV